MKQLISLFVLLPLFNYGQVQFSEIASQKGIDYQGKSFGASWGDINGDGYLDLFLSCHSNSNDLYQTSDVPVYYIYDPINSDFSSIFLNEDIGIPGVDAKTDWHGAAFFDVDNDGDLDQITQRGGTSSNVFYNNTGSLNPTNTAGILNLEFTSSSGRTPGILDINRDGFIDLILNASTNNQLLSPRLMINQGPGGVFEDDSLDYGFDWSGSVFSTTNDFDGDGDIDIISLTGNPILYELIDPTIEGGSPTLSSGLPIGDLGNVFDFLVEDLNGDLVPEIFSVRATRELFVETLGDTIVRGNFSLSQSTQNDPNQFAFSSSDESIRVEIYPNSKGVSYKYVIGSTVSSTVFSDSTSFELNQNDGGISNIPASVDSTLAHIFIRYDDSSSKWIVSAQRTLFGTTEFGVKIEGEGLVKDPLSTPTSSRVQLFIIENGSFTTNNVPESFQPNNFMSVVSADFDNDMDLDIYAVRTTTAKNLENIYWENNNNSSLTAHAAGTFGAAGDGPGIGESVTTIDYNNDGLMDLFVTNGSSVFWLDSAKSNLFENQTSNGNNWLKVELIGIASNPMGLHARVILHAGGRSQLRYQHGGMHRYSQNDPRLHFGLAQNTSIDSLEIFWPSGFRQVITDLDVNQIATITEEVACEEPYPTPENLSAEIQQNGVLLKWDPIPGSIGCQVRGGLASSPSLQTFQVLTPNAKELFAPQSLLQEDQLYRWRVRCGCSTSIIGPWSDFDTFTWNSPDIIGAVTNNQFTLFPNPVITTLNVSASIGQSQEESRFEIFDLQGRLVLQETLYSAGNYTIQLDLSALDSGVYILKVSNGSETYTEKLIKQ